MAVAFGLAKKVLLADTFGKLVDWGYADVGAVSYTHLDVYKRQVGQLTIHCPQDMQETSARSLSKAELDVYKRQGYGCVSGNSGNSPEPE